MSAIEGRIGDLRWRYVIGTPGPHLARWVRGYAGYTERAPGLEVRRHELPCPGLVMIVELEPAIRLGEQRDQRFAHGFVAGVGGPPTPTVYAGAQRGLQVDLSPLGARALFGLDAHELAGGAVGLEDLGARHLAEELAEAPDWPSRFRVADRFFEERLAACRLDLRVAAWLLGEVEASGGNHPIGDLVAQSGYSHGYLGRLCRRDLGLTPKQLSQLVRFQRVVERMRAPEPPSLTRLAFDLGYADPSHLTREVRAIAGVAPSRLAAFLEPELVPTG